MKQLFLLVFLILSSLRAEAQLAKLKDFREKQKQKKEHNWATEHIYSSNIMGLALQTTANQNFSPNKYIGALFTITQNQLLEREKRTHVFDFFGGFGFVSLPESMVPTTSVNARIAYALMPTNENKFKLGGQITGILNSRVNVNNENNAFLAETFVDLAPRLSWAKKIDFMGDPLAFDYTLVVPVVSAGLSIPSFSISGGKEVPRGVFTVNRYQRIQSTFGLSLPPSKRITSQRPRISYSWDFLRFGLGDGRTLVNATHSISFLGKFKTIK